MRLLKRNPGMTIEMQSISSIICTYFGKDTVFRSMINFANSSRMGATTHDVTKSCANNVIRFGR